MDAFSSFFPTLQSYIDLEISNAALEFSYFSFDQCDAYLKLVLQSIISLVDNYKGSPEKIEMITALLIATRADEAVNLLGKIGKLNKLVGLNIKVTKGGSYFKEFMKGSSKKTKNKTKRGGAGCNEACSDNTQCTNAGCPTCVNGTCAAQNQMFAAASGRGGVVVPGPIPYNYGTQDYRQNHLENYGVGIGSDVLSVLQLGTQEISRYSDRATEAAMGSLNLMRERITAADNQLLATRSRMNEMMKEHSKNIKDDFERIYQKEKSELESQETLELTSGVTAGVFGGIVGYRFTGHLINLCEAVSGKASSFLYWLLLTGSSLLEKLPYLTETIPLLDTRCYSKQPFGKIWATMVETTKNATTFSYTYQNMWTGSESYISGASTCFDKDKLYKRIGECAVNTGKEMVLECQKLPNIFDIRSMIGNDAEIFAGILGLILSGIVVYYTVKIVTLQTKLHEYNIPKSTGPISLAANIFKDTTKAISAATGVGALVQIARKSSERSELIEAVRNQQIKYQGSLVTMARYVQLEGESFKKQAEYTALVDEEKTQIAELQKLNAQSASLTEKNIDTIRESERERNTIIAQLTSNALSAIQSQRAPPQYQQLSAPPQYQQLSAPPQYQQLGYPQNPPKGGANLKKTRKHKRKITQNRKHKKYTKKRKMYMRK